MSDLVEFCCFLTAGIVAVTLSIFMLMCAWSAGPSRWACEAYGESTGLSVNYQFWGDCYVTMPDGTVLRKSSAEEMLTKKYQSRYQLEIKQPKE